MSNSVSITELVTYLVKNLVDHPDEVEVTEVKGSTSSVIELRVAKDDLGKVIGRQGRTARAIRTIVTAASAKLKQRTVLEILD